MEIFRKMSFADSTGDAIPFYHEGKYHIFSLTSPPGTTVYPARLRTTWSHSVSDDLVHWEELPTALYPGEGDEPDASGVWTGSVIYGEGKYHAFYTGYCLTAEYQQTICHATSDHFPLVRYSMFVIVTVYIIVSFLRPAYLVARYNLENQDPKDVDFRYVTSLGADGAEEVYEFIVDNYMTGQDDGSGYL